LACRQIAARVGGRGVKLNRLKRKVFEVRHAQFVSMLACVGSKFCQNFIPVYGPKLPI
jgi:hypothetical protein